MVGVVIQVVAEIILYVDDKLHASFTIVKTININFISFLFSIKITLLYVLWPSRNIYRLLYENIQQLYHKKSIHPSIIVESAKISFDSISSWFWRQIYNSTCIDFYWHIMKDFQMMHSFEVPHPHITSHPTPYKVWFFCR
jgi:hypothetical protein